MAHDRLADAIVREIPAPFIGRFLESFEKVKLANANGNGCGNACGNSCIDGIGFVFDRYGQSGLTEHDLIAAQKDIGGLRSSIHGSLGRVLK
jgi:hypothetical protein